MRVTKNLVEFMLPVYASANFSAKKPPNWDDMDNDEKMGYFMENCECTGGLCHQCSDDIETDLDIATGAEKCVLDELEYYSNKKDKEAEE